MSWCIGKLWNKTLETKKNRKNTKRIIPSTYCGACVVCILLSLLSQATLMKTCVFSRKCSLCNSSLRQGEVDEVKLTVNIWDTQLQGKKLFYNWRKLCSCVWAVRANEWKWRTSRVWCCSRKDKGKRRKSRRGGEAVGGDGASDKMRVQLIALPSP